MRDIMVDIETTGTNPNENAIIQIAAVRFDYAAGTVDHEFFDRCLAIPGFRRWDLGTYNWWKKQGKVLDGLLARAEPPRQVLEDFMEWACRYGAPRLWAKPSHFEYNFISGYYKDFDLPVPFGYREAIDLNSFHRGACQQVDVEPLDKQIPFDGKPHNALDDTLHQLKVAFEIRKQFLKSG